MKNYLEILEGTPNFTTAKGSAEEAELREVVYKAFEPVTQLLSLDEKFQLYELIDQLKMHNADSRPTAKQEFLELCAKGSDLQAYDSWHEQRRSAREFRNRWL